MRRLRAVIAHRWRGWLVLVALVVVGLRTDPRTVEHWGDNYQIALPVLALACEATNGGALEYAGRYAVMFVGLHGTKRALGETPLNARPRGGYEGFPSGHTATATFGAANLMTSCVKRQPVVQTAIALAAGYTGASRIATGWHDIWQVMAGAIWGILCALAFGKGRAPRRLLLRAWAWRRNRRAAPPETCPPET